MEYDNDVISEDEGRRRLELSSSIENININHSSSTGGGGGGGRDNKSFPPSIKYIIGNEICERYTFYAIRSIMFIYLLNFYNYNDDTSTSILHSFNFGSYFLPLLGAYLADGVFGKYKTILYFSLVYCVGCIFLGFSALPKLVGDNPNSRSPWALIIGLVLIAIGTGGIKPVISTFCGDQLDARRQPILVERLYKLFSWCISLGGLISTFLSPLFREHLGYGFAFGIPCLFMFIATIIFVSGSKLYRKRPITGSILATSFGIIGRGVWERLLTLIGRISHGESHYNGHWLDRSKSTYDSHAVESVKACLNVLMCFIPLPFYWALFDQSSSRWTLQATQMKSHIGGDLYIQPDQIQVLNPLIVLSIIPLSEILVYRPLRNRNIPFHPLKRIGLGIFLSIIAFLVCTFVQIHIDKSPPNSVSILLQIPQYFIMAVAEIFILIPGLEFAYSQSPSSHKSFIMSGWLLTISLGNIFVVFVVDGIKLSTQWHEFLLFAGCMFVFWIVFIFIAYRFKPSDPSVINYAEEDDAEEDGIQLDTTPIGSISIAEQLEREEEEEYDEDSNRHPHSILSNESNTTTRNNNTESYSLLDHPRR